MSLENSQQLVSLVPSFNGSGHFVRLLEVAQHLLSRNVSVFLLVSSAQRTRFQPEILKLSESPMFDFETHDGIFGLDGPQWGRPDSQKFDRPTKRIRSILKKSDHVWADNVLWPFELNSEARLFGHFTWPNYWLACGASTAVIRDEQSILNEVKHWHPMAAFFARGLSGYSERVHPVGIYRFQRDDDLLSFPFVDEIWVAKGTTGLGGGVRAELSGDMKVRELETIHMWKSRTRPRYFVGRPGIASIRDSLAARVPFLSAIDETDPELVENSRNYANLLDNSDLSTESIVSAQSREWNSLKRKLDSAAESKFSPVADIVQSCLEA